MILAQTVLRNNSTSSRWMWHFRRFFVCDIFRPEAAYDAISGVASEWCGMDLVILGQTILEIFDWLICDGRTTTMNNGGRTLWQ